MRNYRMLLVMTIAYLLIAGTAVVLLALSGCQDINGPRSSLSESAATGASAIVSQDLAQLSVANVTSVSSTGVFSIGWKKFVGPNIADAGLIGEAYAIVQSDTSTSTIHPTGLDIGSVTLAYSGGGAALTKRTAPDGSVLYETFSRGMGMNTGTPVNIPFVANSVYSFTVSGSAAFSAGTFEITAPGSLLTITSQADGDTVSTASDLALRWTGGSAADSVLIRITPHLRPAQLADRPLIGVVGTPGGHHGPGGGPRCRREGPFAIGGPLQGMGPEFAKGVVVALPNTGGYTLSAADLQTLLSGTEAVELMVGVTQVVKKDVAHDGRTVTVLLRDGDRVVLHAK